MSNKRKNKNRGNTAVHPQKSFQDYVADATLAKLSGFIDNEIRQLGQALLQRQAQAVSNLLTRAIALEELLYETVPSITKETLSSKVATIQDRNEGLSEVVNGTVEAGDRVRVEIATRTAEQVEYQASSLLLIDNVGSGQTYGKEIEGAILGMKTNEVKEIKFGQEASMAAKITLDRVSRSEAAKAKVEDQKPTSEVKIEETANASAG